jgi:signal transduction histidine kinase
MSSTTAKDGTQSYTVGADGRGGTFTDRRGLHHRGTADQLAGHAARLARKNEALEDFAGLVAHDVKSSLLSALRSEEPQRALTRALEIVDSILEATRADRAGGGAAHGADCVRQAVEDLGDIRADVITTVTGEFPIPPAALRLVLRNLLANAVAAGAGRIHVSAVARGHRRVVVVDDDGVGLGGTDHYNTGAQLGHALCRPAGRPLRRRAGAQAAT